jgi:DNA gyrase subunit A
VISMSILRHEEIASETRDAYLKLANERRRQNGEEAEVNGDTVAEALPDPEEGEAEGDAEIEAGEAVISEEVFADLAAREEFVQSVTEKGFGVRSSAYNYRITRRGGQGINNMDLTRRSDAVVAVFPVGNNDQIMLVTDAGMVIRCPVHDIRIARRGTQGVSVFRVGEGERVVSVARLPEVAEENGNGEGDDPDGSASDDAQAGDMQANEGEGENR